MNFLPIIQDLVRQMCVPRTFFEFIKISLRIWLLRSSPAKGRIGGVREGSSLRDNALFIGIQMFKGHAGAFGHTEISVFGEHRFYPGSPEHELGKIP
ncbi:MAG: hypothetical protein UY54_C0010G0017, partial [Parcubacteria group bacterium GW2011_GWA2_50_10b]